MKLQFVEAGEIVTTHGLKGEMKVLPWVDSPDILCEFDRCRIGGAEYKIEACRIQKSCNLLKVKGIDTVEAAQVLRGKMLYVDRRDLKLPKGRYLVQDLIGLTVVDADTGETYGTLTDVSQTGANAVYHMATDKGEILIPAIPDVVVEINLKQDVLRLRPMKGLLDDDEI